MILTIVRKKTKKINRKKINKKIKKRKFKNFKITIVKFFKHYATHTKNLIGRIDYLYSNIDLHILQKVKANME
jgi:hypothetical protein